MKRAGRCAAVEAFGASCQGLARPGFHLHVRAWSRRTVVAAASVGDSYDNALAETIFGLFAAEVIMRSQYLES
ncbi:hypothetical protein D1012_14410 [Pseudotabrizicola alkalilacus]|uniref:Transposase n=1 Tax=Pseudotabrizicola alkalilacus TaxID=2305252 RepID=A0A411YZZ6_9RHOB|nr:hypothetical protein D1012_14410 [Pseudotabrizicola alkalilacus]